MAAVKRRAEQQLDDNPSDSKRLKTLTTLTLPDDWSKQLRPFLQTDAYRALSKRVTAAYDDPEVTVFPPREQVFEAFRLTPFDNVKVVVLGQDPYHDDGQAHGLAFSVQEGVKTPPSLRNIFKEIGGPKPPNGNLQRWAEQGVLLLNATLTVQAHKANSHRKFGWQKLTDYVIEQLDKKQQPVVFMLWGNFARKKAALVTNDRHLVLQSAHPSPLSARRGFFGNGHFEAANAFLEANGRDPVVWEFTDQDA